jgi:hypothetical protein
MAADIPLGFDEDYGTACFACDDRGGKPCRPRADHNDIGLAVPVNRVLPCRRTRHGSAQRSRHHPAPLPTMICPERPVAVDREDRRSEAHKTQDYRPPVSTAPPIGHYAGRCGPKAPSTPGRRNRPIWRSSLSVTAAALQRHSRHFLRLYGRCRFSLPTLLGGEATGRKRRFQPFAQTRSIGSSRPNSDVLPATVWNSQIVLRQHGPADEC